MVCLTDAFRSFSDITILLFYAMSFLSAFLSEKLSPRPLKYERERERERERESGKTKEMKNIFIKNP